MPLYDYHCERCGLEDEFITPMVGQQECPKCQSVMTRLMHANYGISLGPVGAYGYYDETLNTYIHTKKHRKQVMREQGVSEYGATPKDGEAWV